MLDLYFRAFSRARWDTFADNRGITAGTPPVVQPGFLVDHIGGVQLTDGVYDHSTFPPTVITAPTFDGWHSVNLRVIGTKVAEDDDPVYTGDSDPVVGGQTRRFRFLRSKIVKFVRDQATVVNLPFRGDTIRAYQFGTGVNRIQLLDPRDIVNYRPREWLGGMSL